MTLVPPDGPIPASIMVVGEAPASEEVRQGRGFCGPSGALLWPLMRKLAGIDRSSCYVTNLSKTPVDQDAEDKIPEPLFSKLAEDLIGEVRTVRPQRILAVGAYAARALLGDRYTSMEACNGIGFRIAPIITEMANWTIAKTDTVVVPTWHPAAALHDSEKDTLAWTAAAISNLCSPGLRIHPVAPVLPPVQVGLPYGTGFAWTGGTYGVDTEGLPDDPICMTVSDGASRWWVEPHDVPWFFMGLHSEATLIFHNALWDWPVLWAMGAPRDIAVRWAWRDTMELAYLCQTDPRGLKDLSYRYLGLRMRTFDDVVLPYYHEMLRAAAEGFVAAGTTVTTHSPKTGKLLKRPKVTMTDAVKPLKRALENPKLLAERMPGLPGPSLRLVPWAEAAEYATQDAFATAKLYEILK